MPKKSQVWRKPILILILSIVIAIILGVRWISSDYNKDKISDSIFMLDTLVTVTLYSENSELIQKCFDECRRYEMIFSRTNEHSELYALNHSDSMEVSDDLLSVLKTAIHFCEISDGSFDITMGEISDMYSFSSDTHRVPSDEELDTALPHVDYRNITIEGNTVTRNDPAAVIDLGAAAKGYIADRLAEFILENGETSAIIDLGGNIMCLGSKPDGSDYIIGIQYPFKDRTETITNVSVSQKSVVTSGIYERSFEQDGVMYHHILNPDTGRPFDNELLAVSIISDSSADGDALSTVCFTLGVEKGLSLIDSLEGIEAVFVTKDYKLHYSARFADFESK
ncbi:MAG: FAD:protein FMN transferase [Bacillota bacterium]|nr:FAD:protein FMN transferase [Bacillota bacterium]